MASHLPAWVEPGPIVGAAALLVLGTLGGIMLADAGDLVLLLIGAGVGALVIWAFVRWFWQGLVVIFAIRASLDHLKSGTASSSSLSPAAVVGLIFLVTSAIWLWRRHRAGSMQRVSPASKALLLLAAVCMVGATTSIAPVSSASSSLRILSSAVMLVVLEQLFKDRPRTIIPLLIATFCSVIGPGLVGISQLASDKPVVAAYGPPIAVGRIEGTFVHPNAFADYLLLLLPLAIALLPHARGRVRWALWASVLSSAGLLLFTYARGAWAAAVIAMLIVGVLQDRRIVAVVLGVIVIALLAVPSIAARLADLSKSHPYTGNADPNSLAWRLYYWGHILPLYKRSPITGIGLDMVQRVEQQGLPPHNVWLQSLIESGAMGALALLNAVVTIIRQLHGRLKGAYDPLGRSIVVGAVAVGIAFLIQTLSENLYTQAVSQWYVLLPLSWALSVRSTGPETWRSDRRSDRAPSGELIAAVAA